MQDERCADLRPNYEKDAHHEDTGVIEKMISRQGCWCLQARSDPHSIAKVGTADRKIPYDLT